MSHRPWLEQAESDLQAAEILSNQSFHSQAVWLAAHAVEKGHKAILVALGLRYEDRHFKHLGHSTAEVSKLLPEILHDPVDPPVAKAVATLDARAIASRYPSPAQTTGVGPAKVLAPARAITGSQQEITDAKLLLDWCRGRIERAAKAALAMKP